MQAKRIAFSARTTSYASKNHFSTHCQHFKSSLVFVLGGPGTGKSTQCKLVADKFTNWKHISAGELLRKEMSTNSPNSQLIHQLIKEGGIVPSHITVELLRNEIVGNEAKKFIVDGFPRNLENKETYLRVLDPLVTMECLIFLSCPEDVMLHRLSHRSKTSGRTDDNIESVGRRIVTFNRETLPVVDWFRIERGNIYEVDGSGTAEEVAQRFQQLFSRLGLQD